MKQIQDAGFNSGNKNAPPPGQPITMNKITSLRLLALVSIASSALAASPVSKANTSPVAADDFLIVAGKRIGRVELGDRKTKVFQALGHWSMMELNGRLGDETEGYNSGFSISYHDSKVANIEVTSRNYHTSEGIGVGSTPDAIRKAFKGGVLTSTKIHLSDGRGKLVRLLKYYRYTDAKCGIGFQFGNNSKHSTTWCDTVTVMTPMP